jgi:hypothetical protein
VGAFDLLANITPAIMTVVGASTSAFSQRVAIPVQQFQTGEVGMWYSEQIGYTGANMVYNSPPQCWKVASGSLPAGLQLTQDGYIQGVPTAVTGSTPASFSLSCWDSFGPPQYSGDSPALNLSINPTPADGISISASSATGPIRSVISSLTVTVTNASQQPLTGAGVLITLPPAGSGAASATFDPATPNIITNADGSTAALIVTGPGGIATLPSLWTNAVQGSYTVTATVPGTQLSASLPVQNTACLVRSITPGTGSTPQQANGPTSGWFSITISGNNFPYQITATLSDASNNVVANAIVNFSVPSSPNNYGSFVDNGGNSIDAVSDASGNVNAGTFTNTTINIMAPGTQTPFTITAKIAGTSVTTTYSLTNIAS